MRARLRISRRQRVTAQTPPTTTIPTSTPARNSIRALYPATQDTAMPHRLAALLCACLLLFPVGVEACTASWYGGGEYLNRHTANGERFDPSKLTAAHRTLAFGSRVRVTYRGRSVVVRISDRGPAKYTGRCIDLSRAAADAIGMRRAGVGSVTLTVLKSRKS